MNMRFGSRIVVSGVTILTPLLGIVLATAQSAGQGNNQAPVEQKPLMAEQVFKNVQVLRGIPVKQFMGTMGFFAASLSLTCTDCHGEESASDWAGYATETPLKQRARQMVVMESAINKANFAGASRVTCYTCHRGNQQPQVIPSFAVQYGTPPPDDPDLVEIGVAGSKSPSADQILDKYIQALGGAQQLAKVNSYTAKGTYVGFDTDFFKVPVEIFAKGPNQRTTVVHLPDGDSTTAYDGNNAWFSAPAVHTPVPVLPLTGGDLEGASVDAALSFPGQLKLALRNWRVGFPDTMIDDKPVYVVQGSTAGGSRVKFYFDKDSGLLVREVRYSSTPVGINPIRIEYSDYRPVAGIKMPFKYTITWTDGQSTTELTDVQPNTPVAASKFTKPAPPR